jgi:DNA-binding Xre family transcriptional regulator
MSKIYIIDALRAHLKARNLTYKDLAAGIDLSEVSIKRLFASGDCTLDRLEQICDFLQIEVADIFKSSPKKRKRISLLTQAQETEFAHNSQLLVVAVCALNFWAVKDMWTHLKLTRGQILSLLKRLDEIGFLELQSSQQYRLLVAHNFAWITGGPIMQMVQGMSHEFFNYKFDGDGEVLRILNVRLSQAALTQLRTRLEQIAQEYEDQSRADSHLPLTERPPVSVCIAARAWIPKFMQDLLKTDPRLSTADLPTLNLPAVSAASLPQGVEHKSSPRLVGTTQRTKPAKPD